MRTQDVNFLIQSKGDTDPPHQIKAHHKTHTATAPASQTRIWPSKYPTHSDALERLETRRLIHNLGLAHEMK